MASKNSKGKCDANILKSAQPPKTNSGTCKTVVSMQNIECPGNTGPFLKVPPPHAMLKKDSSVFVMKKALKAYDVTSSTNSNFETWPYSVPNSTPTKCEMQKSTDTTLISSPIDDAILKLTQREQATSSEVLASFSILSRKSIEGRKPCKGSFNTGAPKRFIGNCPLNIEALAHMPIARQKFYITQDPRKTLCLRNPNAMHRKQRTKEQEFEALEKYVKHAKNVCVSSPPSENSFICEVIDTQNPMKLDFHGLDYKNTYELDEQDTQNQRLFRRIGRYMERRSVKAETKQLVEAELQKEREAVPPCFEIVDRQAIVPEVVIPDEPRYAKLYRSAEKPYNQLIISEEKRLRHNRYKTLYMNRKARLQRKEKEKTELTAKEQDELATKIATKSFEETLQKIDDAFRGSSHKRQQLQRKEQAQRIFPHTIRETERLRYALKQCNLIQRDEAIVKRQFYRERLGKEKNYPDADLELSSDSSRLDRMSPISEQSTDDEDDIVVGKSGSVFNLRGFKFKLGNDLRGKRHQREITQGQRKVKGCMTRDEWIASLDVQIDEHVPMDTGMEPERGPDSPNMQLYQRFGNQSQPHEQKSAVREYIDQGIGHQYERIKKPRLKLIKPKPHYRVKKFNLINFLYAEKSQKKEDYIKLDPNITRLLKPLNLQTTQEYIAEKEAKVFQRKDEENEKRLRLLGIPCRKNQKTSRVQTTCENSESSTDSDWVPNPESEVSDNSEYNRKMMAAKENRLPLRQRGNMPASKIRESTLRRHPRHPRDYLGERVPSELFDQTVRETHLPHLHKLANDVDFYENVNRPKRPYTDLFEARHHHDHWDPTEKKAVDIHYEANIIHPETTIVETSKQQQVDKFDSAEPPCNLFVDMDLTLPNANIDSIIKQYQQKSDKRLSAGNRKDRSKNVCISHEYVKRSRKPDDLIDLQYPGRKEYLDFLQSIREQMIETKIEEKDDSIKELLVDKDTMYKDLEYDLKSIESCLTSLDSSQCSNFTNDSGSFLLMGGKTKIPLDYIRKSIVPFEELARSRFQITPIDDRQEPARNIHHDKFFTYTTRLQNGLRLNMEVPIEDVRNTLLGPGKEKYPGVVAIDIDEDYVNDLKKKPPYRPYRRKTIGPYLRDAKRMKLASMMIQGDVVRKMIYDRLNEFHWHNMLHVKTLYDKLFSKWEKMEYDASMEVVNKVKSYYELTDKLKLEMRDLERRRVLLNLDIVFLEGHWIRRIQLQNFHYLVADLEWRRANDWIHCIETKVDNYNGVTQLEDFDESIAKRTIVNIRKRDKDDAMAIRAYFHKVFLPNRHESIFVFPDYESFLVGIENMKMQTFVLLLEMHFTLSIHTELQGCLEVFTDWCVEDLRQKQEYVERKSAKKYFMEERAKKLAAQARQFIKKPIEDSFNSESFNRDRSILAVVWRSVVPATLRGSSDQDADPIDMIGMMSDTIFEMMSRFETMPIEYCRKFELKLRRDRFYAAKLSKATYFIERRIDSEMKKVRRNLEPPYLRPKRVGKLPRTKLCTKAKEVIDEEPPISENAKFLYMAFHESDQIPNMTDILEAHESLQVIDTMQENVVPFYFDHFLKINGYTPNYDFKTRIELRDGPEVKRFARQELIPEVMERVQKWEAWKKKVMEENIEANPKMYENVQA